MHNKLSSFSFSYGRILSSYPLAVVAAVATISVACLVAVFTTHSIPDFSDPQLVCTLQFPLSYFKWVFENVNCSQDFNHQYWLRSSILLCFWNVFP